MPAHTENRFGGAWTLQKLEILERYLKSYTTALKNTAFLKIYIDAFAGDGYPKIRVEGDELEIVGSPIRALSVNPGFDDYHFIEADPGRADMLRDEITRAAPGKSVTIHSGDANKILQEVLERYHWKSTRGVVFLDPFGLEVDWDSIVVPLAATECVDVWFFVSLSGIYRNAPKDADDISPDKAAALTKFLGTDEWKSAFYEAHPQQDMFKDKPRIHRAATWEDITQYIRARLSTAFKGGVLAPMIFTTETNAPLFALFFAVANPNPRAVQLANRIATHLLRP